jgi:hypothetical protein
MWQGKLTRTPPGERLALPAVAGLADPFGVRFPSAPRRVQCVSGFVLT